MIIVPNLNRLIRKKNVKLFFRVESIADINTVRGFLEVLGIQREHVVISYSSEVTGTMTKAAFRGCAVIKGRVIGSNYFPIAFDTEGGFRLSEKRLIVNYVPFKYCHSVRVSSKERACLRKAMRIKNDRKIIVVSCSTREEANVVLKACEGLTFFQKPLIILGLRKPDISFVRFLKRVGLRAHDRRDPKKSLVRFGNSDVVVLNTVGELFDFLKAANLAIVGHDRNLFEPALLGVPILYFGRPLSMNKTERKLARLFKLYWRKNRMAKRLLDEFGGATPIRRATFSRQIDSVLRNPESMIRGTRKAVRAFRHRVLPASRLRAASVLAEGIARLG